jgi:DNA-binding winged helix-turn-helix (wHTH) protein
MAPSQRLLFDDFALDVRNRSLTRGGVPIELSSRYFDALALLVGARGDLVGKQRFFDEVWGDTIVTDAALTQCIKDVRRALGDDAGNPRYVRTVPGHGYRFIADVREEGEVASHRAPPRGEGPGAEESGREPKLQTFLTEGLAGTLGGGVAGAMGGLLYGSALAYSAAGKGLGTSSVLVVLLVINVLVGLAGGFGVSFGMAAGRILGSTAGWTVAGGTIGGFVVGGIFKLLGSDAFNLIFGRALGDITGAFEGAALGLAIAAGALLAGGIESRVRARPVIGAAIATGIMGAVLITIGGSLMGGSLEQLAGTFAGSRIDLSPLGRLAGEPGFGRTTQAVLAAIEGAIFGACVVAAIAAARRRLTG